jgi:hypothetical protein
VLEDLQDWDNADHLAGLSLDRARCCIAQLAGLHAWSINPVNADALREFPSLDMPMTRDLLPPRSSRRGPSTARKQARRFRMLSHGMQSGSRTSPRWRWMH